MVGGTEASKDRFPSSAQCDTSDAGAVFLYAIDLVVTRFLRLWGDASSFEAAKSTGLNSAPYVRYQLSEHRLFEAGLPDLQRSDD